MASLRNYVKEMERRDVIRHYQVNSLLQKGLSKLDGVLRNSTPSKKQSLGLEVSQLKTELKSPVNYLGAMRNKRKEESAEAKRKNYSVLKGNANIDKKCTSYNRIRELLKSNKT